MQSQNQTQGVFCVCVTHRLLMVFSLLVVSHLSPPILKVKTQGFLLYPESVLMDLISSSGDIMYLNIIRLASPMMLS